MGFEIKMVCDTCGETLGVNTSTWVHMGIFIEYAIQRMEAARNAGIDHLKEVTVICPRCAATTTAKPGIVRV